MHHDHLTFRSGTIFYIMLEMFHAKVMVDTKQRKKYRYISIFQIIQTSSHPYRTDAGGGGEESLMSSYALDGYTQIRLIFIEKTMHSYSLILFT